VGRVRFAGSAALSSRGQPPPARDCCPAQAADARTTRIARHFDRRISGDNPDDVDLPHLVEVSARLLDMLGDVAHVRPSVLDLGCGAGGDAIRLAQAGARLVTGVDVSPASIDIARRRAVRCGLSQRRVRFATGDAASDPLEPHDWVLLDRVVCCYSDAGRLLANALAVASRRLAFTVPESRGWRGLVNTTWWTVENLARAVVRPDACRGYVHAVASIERRLEDAGFRKLRSGRCGLWYAAVFEREPSPCG
jgi:SAM-dependent methyltransferase